MINLRIRIGLVVAFLCPLSAFAQAPAIEWEKTFGSGAASLETSLQKTSDGGYILAGMSSNDGWDLWGNHGGYDYWVIKLSNMGDTEWERSLGGTYEDDANCIIQTFDGGYMVAGQSASGDGDVTGHEGSCVTLNYWIVKLSSTGEIQWEESLGLGVASSIVQADDSGYVVAGTGSLIKLDSVGKIEWKTTISGRPNSLTKTFAGGYVVAGYDNSGDSNIVGNHGGFDYWVAKFSSLGNIEWQKSYGGSGDDFALAIVQTNDSGFIINGQSNSTDGNVTGNHGNDNYWVVKLDRIGEIQWENSFGGSVGDFGACVSQTRDGGYIVGGLGFSTNDDETGNHGAGDYWIVKLSDSGSIQWEQSYGGSNNDQATSIEEADDGGYIIAGSTESNDGEVVYNPNSPYSYCYWVVKLAPESLMPENSVIQNNNLTQDGISSAYPNPFSSSICISVPNHIHSIVSVNDMMGRQVTELHRNDANQYVWTPGSSVSAGTYFIVVRTPTSQSIKYVLLEK